MVLPYSSISKTRKKVRPVNFYSYTSIKWKCFLILHRFGAPKTAGLGLDPRVPLATLRRFVLGGEFVMKMNEYII